MLTPQQFLLLPLNERAEYVQEASLQAITNTKAFLPTSTGWAIIIER
jgi:hypothetical protein